MNLQQILNEVNKDIDDSLETGTLIGWINRALDIASPIAKYQQRITLLFEYNKGDYDLPDDLIRLAHVIGTQRTYEEIPLLDNEGTGYKMWGNTIGFQNLNEPAVEMYYYAYYPHLQNLEDVPALPSIFHDLLVLYAVGRARYQDEEENLQALAMREFVQRLDEFRVFSSDKRKNTSVKIKSRW